MPFQSGTLLSSFVLILCLGMNLAFYPEVREMLHESKDRASIEAAPVESDSRDSASSFYPEIETPAREKPKTSNANRPIPIKSKPTVEEKPEPVRPEPVRPEPVKESPKEEKKEKPKKTADPEKSDSIKKEPVEKEKKEEKNVEKTVGEVKPKTGPTEKKATPEKREVREAENPPVISVLENREKDDSESGGKPLPSVFPVDTRSDLPQNPLPEKTGPDAFLPILPSGMEEEYRSAEGKNVNQANLPPPPMLPLLKQERMVPDRAAPLYASPFHAGPPMAGPPMPEPTAPVRDVPLKKLPEVTETVSPPAVPIRKPPKAVWDTVESIMEQPIFYETLPPIESRLE